jgi:hypothetical protein
LCYRARATLTLQLLPRHLPHLLREEHVPAPRHFPL